jgi:hypothetical protein
MSGWRAAALLAFAFLAATSCRKQGRIVPPPVSTAVPSPVKVDTLAAANAAWDSAMVSVSYATQRGDMMGADSILRSFAMSKRGCSSTQADYVRGLLYVSPTAPTSKIAEALPLFDRYLGSPCLTPSKAAEVNFIRRLAADVLLKTISDSASAEEVKKLRDQLETTKKELDRLKMRVIPP